MYYNLIKTPAVVKTGKHIIGKLDQYLQEAHLFYPNKILVTQECLYEDYKDVFKSDFHQIIFVKGGTIEEAPSLLELLTDKESLIVAFGGGSVLDLVKYCASKKDIAYINLPSTLSNDAVYSCVARLSCDGKKTSYGVQPPVGIVVDFDIIKRSPKKLVLAGVADIVSNLSACEDWLLSHNNTGEKINEMAYMLAKEAALPLFDHGDDFMSDAFLFDLTNSIVTSGLSMIISGDTRGTSGAEHLISHAIDEYFPEKSTIHGLQVGWAHLFIEKNIRKNEFETNRLEKLFSKIGLLDVLKEEIPWSDDEFESLIPYARKIRKRYTVFNILA